MTVRMTESANTASKDKSNTTLAFTLQIFSVSDTHKEGYLPFSCLCEGLSPSGGELGSKILKYEFHTIAKHRFLQG